MEESNRAGQQPRMSSADTYIGTADLAGQCCQYPVDHLQAVYLVDTLQAVHLVGILQAIHRNSHGGIQQ
jgi:hypothetical protein